MKRSHLLCFFIALAAISCGKKDDYKSSEDGYKYKFIKEGSGDEPVEGKYFLFHMSYGPDEDSVIFSTANLDRPSGAFCAFDKWDNNGKFFKFLKTMQIGDSALLKIDAGNFYGQTLYSSMPSGMTKEDTLLIKVGAYDIVGPFQFTMMSKPGMKAQHDQDIQKLQSYFEENNIENVKSTESGLHYVIHEQGSGATPQTGDNITVHYTGKLIDGTKFDSSLDRDEPFSFKVGVGQVIMGWDEGLMELSEGSKATLYIPSTMAYGEKGAGSSIPPNSILIFDVELIKINADAS